MSDEVEIYEGCGYLSPLMKPLIQKLKAILKDHEQRLKALEAQLP